MTTVLTCKDSIQVMIEEAGFDYTNIELPLNLWPPAEEPAEAVREICYGDFLTTGMAKLKTANSGNRFVVSPFTALQYELKHPQPQSQYRRASIFEVNQQQWFLMIGRHRTERFFVVSTCKSHDSWEPDVYFLLI